MSLLWRNRIQVFMAPDRIELVGFTRGFRSTQCYAQSSPCTQTSTTHQWKISLQTLEKKLAQVTEDFRRSAELYVTLSNHFVRYGIIAPQPALANPDELMSYAGFQMREIYGERIENWVLSLSSWDPYRGALCAAIARDLQSALEVLTQQYAIRQIRITPYFAEVLDYWSKWLVGKQIWFVLVEPGRFCLVSLIDGVWRSVRNQKVVINLQEELLSALIQESIMLGVAQSAERVYVYAPGQTGLFTDNRDARWQFVHLSDESCPTVIRLPWRYGIRDHA